jgi:hypothetical protein
MATLRASTFDRLVRARHAVVAADRRLDALEDQCECPRRCKCSLRPAIRAAEDAQWEAEQHLRECTDSYREFLAAFGPGKT